MLKYSTRTQSYTAPTNITLDIRSNGLTIKNKGSSVLVFNEDPLDPTESKAIGGNYGEILIGRYYFRFQDPNPLPPGYVRNDFAIITEKYYLPNQNI